MASRMNKQPQWALGALSPSKRGTVKDYVLPPQEFETPQRVCNASSKLPLELSKLWTAPARPGSDHRHQSFGQGC